MKKLIILGSFLVFAVALYAQNNYFLFIQSENSQPYYVHINGKTLSSSPVGHLIIAGLKDSVYGLNIGFPKNQYPEQFFPVPVNKKDGGYQLKNLGTEGWSLVNMQTLQPVKAHASEPKKQTIAYGDVKKTDNFSMLMAGLVNDSAVLYTSIVKADPPKENLKASVPDVPVVTASNNQKRDSSGIASAKGQVIDTLSITQIAPPAKDSAVANPLASPSTSVPELDSGAVKSEAPKEELPKNNSVNAKPGNDAPPISANKPPTVDTSSKTRSQVASNAPPPLIIAFSEIQMAGGTEMIFLDRSSVERIDTIKILIPFDTVAQTGNQHEAAKPDSSALKKDSQKAGPGKLIGKVFRKRDDRATPDGKSNGSHRVEKKSTIKVTTVEKAPAETNDPGKTHDLSLGSDADSRTTSSRDSSRNSSSGGFFSKIFGKKNEPEPANEQRRSDSGTSPVRVAPAQQDRVESKAASTDVSNNEASDEVRKLRKAQEEEEKTSTERFFGKVFGKRKSEKKDSSDRKDSKGDQVSIKVINVDASSKPDTSRTAINEKKPVILNSDCSSFATDTDIDKLKIKMLSRKDIDAQIGEAKKFFKTKCLSTNQVKALSTLYKTDAEKYKLFDASYPFVSDSSNFMDLVVLLNEPYYINRFIAMVRM